MSRDALLERTWHAKGDAHDLVVMQFNVLADGLSRAGGMVVHGPEDAIDHPIIRAFDRMSATPARCASACACGFRLVIGSVFWTNWMTAAVPGFSDNGGQMLTVPPSRNAFTSSFGPISDLVQ
jgi:hypothetical protein